MGKRKTTDIFKKEVYNLVKDEYILLDEYEKSNKKVLFKHILCNSEFKMSPNRFLCGDRCPKCGKEKRRKKLLKDDKWFNEKLNEKYGSDYILRDTYKGTKGRLHIEHAVCGNIFLTFPNNILTGRRCPFCFDNKKGLEGFKKDFSKLEDEFELLSEFTSYLKPIQIRHKACNSIFTITPKQFFSRKTKCHSCNKLFNNEKEFIVEFQNQLKNEYTYISSFTTMHKKLKIRHNICKTEYLVTPYHLLVEGTRCPKCKNINNSKGVRLIEEFFKNNNINFIKSYYIPDCKVKRSLEYDFIIKDENNNILYAIEYDGEQHFKNKFKNNNLQEQRRNDNIKNNYAIENKIKLIRISYKMENHIIVFLNKIFLENKINDYLCTINEIESYWKQEKDFIIL